MSIKYADDEVPCIFVENTQELLEALNILSLQVWANLNDESELLTYLDEAIGKVRDYLEG